MGGKVKSKTSDTRGGVSTTITPASVSKSRSRSQGEHQTSSDDRITNEQSDHRLLIHPIVPDSSNPIQSVDTGGRIRIIRAIKGRITLMIWTIYDICYQIDFSDLYQHDQLCWFGWQRLPMMSEAGVLPQSPNAKYGMIPESDCWEQVRQSSRRIRQPLEARIINSYQ